MPRALLAFDFVVSCSCILHSFMLVTLRRLKIKDAIKRRTAKFPENVHLIDPDATGNTRESVIMVLTADHQYPAMIGQRLRF